mmetsp:Transcript_56301/g.171460  ORF Transcript_56301/g.171460 Transcript_56301/m.171460 type:complete len:212 (+) Transcript_56301:497-1132(+)
MFAGLPRGATHTSPGSNLPLAASGIRAKVTAPRRIAIAASWRMRLCGGGARCSAAGVGRAATLPWSTRSWNARKHSRRTSRRPFPRRGWLAAKRNIRGICGSWSPSSSSARPGPWASGSFGVFGKAVGRGLMPPALPFDDWAPPEQKTSTPWADTPSCWGVVHESLAEEQRKPQAGMRGVFQHDWRCCRYQRFALLCKPYRQACRALLLCL